MRHPSSRRNLNLVHKSRISLNTSFMVCDWDMCRSIRSADKSKTFQNCFGPGSAPTELWPRVLGSGFRWLHCGWRFFPWHVSANKLHLHAVWMQ